jgi:hypothetical protein
MPEDRLTESHGTLGTTSKGSAPPIAVRVIVAGCGGMLLASKVTARGDTESDDAAAAVMIATSPPAFPSRTADTNAVSGERVTRPGWTLIATGATVTPPALPPFGIGFIATLAVSQSVCAVEKLRDAEKRCGVPVAEVAANVTSVGLALAMYEHGTCFSKSV